ncbi:uncharacterized protein LOC116138799 [Pistacia vera]|uniref:uncharacterized protein LOC116138799 n=1 Tax=Pistacia vera TaxID=55513 RepID=UPI0012638E23|nr:uncharacterized protein LOC116138799 [Pistacia vera]
MRSPNEHTLYVRELEGELVIVSLYVDDLLITGSISSQLDEFKKVMHSEFKMSDLGEMPYFLGMEINQASCRIFVNQRKYANEVLKKFGMDKCKPVDTPLVANQKLSKEDGVVRIDEGLYRSLIGCLLYLTATKLDLMYATSLLSRFMSNPSEIHLRVAKRVVRYIKGIPEFGVWFKRFEDFQLVRYSDSDWAGSIDDIRSTSDYMFFLDSGAACWLSKKKRYNRSVHSKSRIHLYCCCHEPGHLAKKIFRRFEAKTEESYCDSM